ncbi:hypothetical protein [Alkalibacillus silvisoli]|uniref:hypothetical protein n=1 Tax=Alkalibacillus silvisoli TaxID=392823 RepID=UPI0031D83DA8
MTKKTVIVGLVGSFVVVNLVVMVWLYSNFNEGVSKSDQTTHDKLRQYINSFEELESSYNIDFDSSTNRAVDHVSVQIQYVIGLVEQEIINKELENVKVENIDNILFEIRDSSDSIKGLVSSEGFFSKERQYLESSLDTLQLLEDLIDRFKQETTNYTQKDH